MVLGGALGARQGLGAVLAVAPGALTAAVVAAFGRHGIASQLCSEVPHHLMPNVFGTVTSPPTLVRYVIGGRPPPQTDYHDWVCRNVMPIYDNGITDLLTGYDWTRWLTTVAFDVGVVFILFASRKPEIEQEPTPKSLRAFVCLVITLGLIVIESVPGFGVPRMV